MNGWENAWITKWGVVQVFVRPRDRPNKTWSEVMEEDGCACNDIE